MSDLRFLTLLTLAYGLIWLITVGVFSSYPSPSSAIAEALLATSLYCGVFFYPSAAISIYLARQTEQRRWQLGLAASILSTVTIFAWSVWHYGTSGMRGYDGLEVAIFTMPVGIFLGLAITTLGTVSKIQHKITRMLGFTTLGAIVASFGTHFVLASQGQASLVIMFIAFLACCAIGMSALFSSAYHGTVISSGKE